MLGFTSAQQCTHLGIHKHIFQCRKLSFFEQLPKQINLKGELERFSNAHAYASLFPTKLFLQQIQFRQGITQLLLNDFLLHLILCGNKHFNILLTFKDLTSSLLYRMNQKSLYVDATLLSIEVFSSLLAMHFRVLFLKRGLGCYNL